MLPVSEKKFCEFLFLTANIDRSMSVTHHLCAYVHGQVVGRIEGGQNVTQAATAVGVPKSVISQDR